MTSPANLQVVKTGLTKPGVVVLQTFFIGIFSVGEVELRHGIGVYTGLMICLAVLGTVRFGRPGTEYVSAATAPLAFATVTLLATAIADGLHVTKVGVDFVASLASAAPYLLVAASYGWFSYFRFKRSHPTK
jgi:hypothetical protein